MEKERDDRKSNERGRKGSIIRGEVLRCSDGTKGVLLVI